MHSFEVYPRDTVQNQTSEYQTWTEKAGGNLHSAENWKPWKQAEIGTKTSIQEEKDKQNYADFRIIAKSLMMNLEERERGNKNFKQINGLVPD